MKKATQDIITVTQNQKQYHMSIVQKQNDSGIMFNQRIFYLLPNQYIAYISQVKINQAPQRIQFDKPKVKISIADLKNVLTKESQLTIRFIHVEGGKRVQKAWLLKMSSAGMAKKWLDLLKQEKTKQQLSKSPSKLSPNKNMVKTSTKILNSQEKEKRPLGISRNLEISQVFKKEKESNEIGVNVSPRNNQKIVIEPPSEKKEIGTYMSEKTNSEFNNQLKEKPVQKRQIGTVMSQRANSSIKGKNEQYEQINKPIQQQKNKQQINNDYEERVSDLRNKDRSQQPGNYTDRSLINQTQINKSMRSQPTGNRVQASKTILNNQRLEPPQKRELSVSKKQPSPFSKKQSSLREPSVANKKQSVNGSKNASQVQQQKAKANQVQLLQSKEKGENKSVRSSVNKSISKKNEPIKEQENPPSSNNQINKKLQPPIVQNKLQNQTALSNRKYITPQQFEKLNASKSSISNSKSLNPPPNQTSKIQKNPSSSILNRSFQQKSSSSHTVQQQNTSPLLAQQPKPPQQKTPTKIRQQPILQQIDSAQDDTQIQPWVFRYIKHNHKIFQQFKSFCKQLLIELIQDIRHSQNIKKYRPKLTKNNILHYVIEDVEVKMAVMELEMTDDSKDFLMDKVCSKIGVKLLQNQFNSFNLLYEYLGNQGKLRVPMVCLCEINGFVGLFKIIPKIQTKSYKLRQLQPQLQSLKQRSKIDCNLIQNPKFICPLDQKYYNKFKTNQDQTISYNLYFLQQINEYLLPDLISDRNDFSPYVLRQELVQIYANMPVKNNVRDTNKNISKIGDFSNLEVETLSRQVLKVVSNAIVEIDTLQCFFFNSQEFSQFMHSRGLNIRYAGHLYEHLKIQLQRKFIMTQMASRSCKSLFRKTIQDITLQEDTLTPQQLNHKICDFFNCILGNTYETAAIWKVLSTHSKAYFGIDLNFSQISKGHFIISIVHNCKLDVAWDRIHPDEAFKSNLFFSQRNFKGLRSCSKCFTPVYWKQYETALKIVGLQENEQNFELLINQLNLTNEIIPEEFVNIENQIKKYLSFFINPEKASTSLYSHLGLFDNLNEICPSRLTFDMMLMEIKWYLKLKSKQSYIRCCDRFILLATKYYGQFHPIFSQLYDLFSAYHLTNGDHQDSITFAKSSLVNTLKICGTYHQKTSQSYYHLALCYIKANRREQAMAHIKKSKMIFENQRKTDGVSYAMISLKLALLHLNQNQIEECLRCASQSLAILQKQQQSIYEDEITQCFQIINRCFQLQTARSQLIAISQRCSEKLQFITNSSNLQKMLKIYLYPILSSITPQQASNYLDIISQLNTESSENTYQFALQSLQQRLAEESFIRNFSDYLLKISSIERYIRQENVLGEWISFREVYARETINDFISMTQELIIFLGEGFVTGSLRQAL